MDPAKTRRTLSLVLLVSCLLTLPAAAGRRRAVRSPAPLGPEIIATINGTVLDDATGQPIANVEARANGKSSYTGANGKFRLREVSGHDSIQVTVERSGYQLETAAVTSGGSHDITIRMTSKPTVLVRETGGATHNVDFESLTFGYVVLFGGYADATYDDFCRADGTQVTVDRVELKKITGPATPVASAACCEGDALMKVNLELKSGSKFDAIFSDSCNGYEVDLIAREHVSGDFLYISFGDIAEVVFP